MPPAAAVDDEPLTWPDGLPLGLIAWLLVLAVANEPDICELSLPLLLWRDALFWRSACVPAADEADGDDLLVFDLRFCC